MTNKCPYISYYLECMLGGNGSALCLMEKECEHRKKTMEKTKKIKEIRRETKNPYLSLYQDFEKEKEE